MATSMRLDSVASETPPNPEAHEPQLDDASSAALRLWVIMSRAQSAVATQAAINDAGQLFGKGVIAGFQPLDIAGEKVEGNHRRDGREQADGGGEQRF